jgi:DNA-binding transcriptional regulator YiaG
MERGADWLLTLEQPDGAAEELQRFFGGEIHSLETTVMRAAGGEWKAAREYVVSWRRLTNLILSRIREEHPDLVVEGPSGQLLIIDVKGDPIEFTTDRLLAIGAAAPFSGWVARVGLGRGIALRLLAEVRECVPGAVPLVPEPGLSMHWASGEAMRTALLLLESALVDETAREAPLTKSPVLLKRVMELLELDRTELAGLFDVKRQAVEQWEQRGVPVDRQAKLVTIVAIVELLGQRLLPSVLPGVVRRKAPAYQGRSMLQMIAEDKHEALLESIRESFDWATTA